MFIKSIYTCVVISTLLAVPFVSAQEQDQEQVQEQVQVQDDLVNQTANVTIGLVKTNYKLEAPGVLQEIKSDTAKIRGTYSKLIGPRYVAFSALHLYQVTIANNATGAQDNELMGGVEAGVRYFINSRWSATLSGELQRLVHFQIANNILSGGGHWSPTINAAAYFQALSRTNYSLIPSLKVSILAGTGEADWGTAYVIGANYNYYLPLARVTAALAYESRSQKYKTVDLRESGPVFSLGAGYSF